MKKGRTEYAIEIEDLNKVYPGAGEPALQAFCLAVEKGSLLGLLGPNGAGKTTLISILCTLQRYDSGRVMVCGYDAKKEASKIRRRIGLVPQEIALYPSLTARENLRYFARIQAIERLGPRIVECLEIVGLLEAADRLVSEFSGGMKRRLNLAVALLHEPEILFLDEPTVGVDPQSRKLIFDRLRYLNGRGVTSIYTSHHIEEVQRLCSSVAVMDRGVLLVHDRPEVLVRQGAGHQNLEELFISLTEEQEEGGPE